MNADGTGETQLALPTSVGSVEAPAWSPNGTKLAFDAFGVGIYAVNADGSGLKQTTDLDPSTLTDDRSPSWSPGGSKIAFSQGVGVTSNYQIVAVNSNGTGSQIDLSNNGFNDQGPAWSPGETKIAFVRTDPSTQKESDLHDARPATPPASTEKGGDGIAKQCWNCHPCR